MIPFESLEDLLTSSLGFGLVTATPLQRACCWVIQGDPIPDRLWVHAEVQSSFGGHRPTPGAREVLLLCGVRSAKTLISAAACVWKALTADLTQKAGLSMRKGERPVVSLVSRTMENARESMNYISGAVMGSFLLRGYLVGEPKADKIVLQHHSGTQVVIRVVAMSSTGVTLVSRWCIAVLFDEAPRMASEDEGKINLQEQVRAINSRIIPGGVILYVGSPYGAKGFVYTLFQENWQKPYARIPVVRAFAYHMNPVFWTPARCAELQRDSIDDYRTDVLAEFRDPEEQLYAVATLNQMFRPTQLVIPYEPGKTYTAAMDPGSSKNAWTFGIAETPDNRHFTIVYACEWRGSKAEPLSPKAVLTQCFEIMQGYHLETSLTDQWAADANRDLARDIGFGLSPITVNEKIKNAMHKSMHSRALQGLLSLPPIPEMRNDFIYLKRRFMTDGTVKIITPETQDGRHCDYAAMSALLCGSYLEAYEESKAVAAAAAARAPKPYARMTEEEREDLEDKLAQADWLWDDEKYDPHDYAQ